MRSGEGRLTIMVVFGEVQTGLLQHSKALGARQTAELLSLAPGEPVRISARPLAYARSPQFLTGLDCHLPVGGRAARAVGTAIGRAILIGGHVIQASTFTEIRPGTGGRRPPWSHYLSRPGVLETVGTCDLSRVVSDATARHRDTALNLAAVTQRTLDLLRRHRILDRRAPIRTGHTRLRWVAYPSGEAPAAKRAAVSLTIKDSPQRIITLRCEGAEAEAVATLCEDVALHDWLLTTLLNLWERAGVGERDPGEVLQRLRPAIEHLIPLWMPTVRVEPTLHRVWTALEKRPGFTRQWENLVQRVRDRFTVAAATPLPQQIHTGC